MSTPTPLISVCIPTHHGRSGALRELITEAIEQAWALPELVEICVSDNASRDGTEEMVNDIASSSPCRLVYQRQPRDLGLTANLLRAIELAHGRYCWLLGSDDLLAPRAMQRAIELLDDMPDVTGYVVGALHIDASDPRLRSRALPRSFFPGGEHARVIHGIDAIYEECGNAWCALSWSIVQRELWVRAARHQALLLDDHPIFPQVLVLAAMAAGRPCWGWLPEPLVHQRNATTFLFEGTETGMAVRWTRIINAVASAWAAAIGRRGGVRWRRRMRRLHEVWGSAADVRATKLYDHPSLSSQSGLTLACLRAFWPSRTYWREVLAASVIPAWVTRARYGFGDRSGQRRRLYERPELSISGSPPRCMFTGSVMPMKLSVRNDGGRAIPADGVRAVTIGQRWFTSSGQRLREDALGINELAAFPQPLPHSIRGHRQARAELILYAPNEPGFYRLELAAHQHGHGWLDGPDGLPLATADVEIAERDIELSKPD